MYVIYLRLPKSQPYCYFTVRMVEGHQCHRTGHNHKKLLGQRFKATSPNARFTDGSTASCSIAAQPVIQGWLDVGNMRMLTLGDMCGRRQGA